MSILSRINRDILTGKFEREVALSVHQQIKKRIFDDGLDATGRQIGTYSPGYLRRRARAGYSGNNVTLEFTGQMRNDFQLVDDGGVLGSGFANSFNFEKSEYVEDTYKKDIFSPTEGEINLLTELINRAINRVTNGV
jgi:hypothetical protein